MADTEWVGGTHSQKGYHGDWVQYQDVAHNHSVVMRINGKAKNHIDCPEEEQNENTIVAQTC